jgi:hypothetical protein
MKRCCYKLKGTVSRDFRLLVFSTKLAKLVAIFSTDIVETGGKFAAGVVDTGGAP